MAILRGILGIVILLGLVVLFSEKRSRINWRLVGSGMLLQIVLALLVLKVGWIRAGFDFVAAFFVRVLEFTEAGSVFLFGDLVTNTESFGYIFAFQVLPTIVFFAALTSLLYYLNILQYIVYGCAWVMKKTMRLSGAETLATAANIFVGQTEAPLVVKPYIEKMSRSEIMALMTGGMATIAGAVLAAYVGLLGGGDPAQQQLFATHLLAASLLSAPAALVAAKILLPETEPVNQQLLVPRQSMGSNVLDAITQGTTQGVKLAVNVGAMLLVFTAFISMINYLLLHGVGEPTGLNGVIRETFGEGYEGLNLQVILGVLFAPVAWIIGVPNQDLLVVGQLLGEKTILNEFYAYSTFSQLKADGVLQNPRSVIIAAYALCGFANFASIGIQIGGISAIAPGQRHTLCALGIKALIGGTFACLLTACIAGMLV